MTTWARRAGVGRALVLATLGVLAACDLPRDPRHTLERVTGGTLHVGVSEAPPWVVRRGEEPAGVEPELVREFARSIDARIRWSWGSAGEHMEALKLYELDIAIGGFTRATPWRKHVGLTQPYHTTRIVVAGPPGASPVGEEEVEGTEVAVPRGGPIGGLVRKKGGAARAVDDLRHAEGLLAAPDYELASLGRDTTGFVVGRNRHVMAVPPGENGFLMALETALHGEDVDALLARETGGAQ